MFITGDVGVTFLSSYPCETPEIKDCNLKLQTKMNLSTPSYILSGPFLAQEKRNQRRRLTPGESEPFFQPANDVRGLPHQGISALYFVLVSVKTI